MPREVVEQFGGDVLDSNGDVKSVADYSDGFGNTIELPDEPVLLPITRTAPAEARIASEAQPDDLTPLERAQKEWDDRFDEFDNNAPSTDIARERMVSKYGQRPEVLADVSQAAVLADKAVAHAAVDSFKQAALQRRLDEVDANPRLRPDEKESEKLLIRARYKAQEDIRRRELGRD